MTGLFKKDIYNIKLHKMLASLLRVFDNSWIVARETFFILSRKAAAQRLLRKGEIYEIQGEAEQAIVYFEKALKKYPKLTEAHLDLCRSCLKTLSISKAKKHGMIFLEKKPDAEEGNLYMGVILYYEKEYEKALTHLKKAEMYFDVREKKRASTLEYMGECYLKLGKINEAVACLEESIKVNPNTSGDKKIVSLGEAYYFLGRKDDALNTFKKAISINPGNHETWNNIGVLLWSDGQGENACQCFRKSLEIETEYGEALANLMMVEKEMGLQKDKNNKKKKIKILR